MKKLMNHADVGVEMKSTTATKQNRTRDTTTTPTTATLGYDDKMDSKTAE